MANLSLKEIDYFIETLRIFPGHRVKVYALIEKISNAFKPDSTNNNTKNSNNNTNNFTNFNNLYNTYKKNASNAYINTIAGKKRFHSTGQNRLRINNPKKLRGIYSINKNIGGIGGIYKKPKSVEPVNSKNRIIKNFLNNEGFGFNYFLKDKQDMTEEEYIDIVNKELSGKTESSDKKNNYNNNNKGKI